ncbi:hypothetical protein AVEN_257877-1 [Araneus ventricosus]|uniref:Uncharacterized protein n=1 Tax=Araneus ventricosus TaxID=182803 RepID=A0A4Y2PZI3_ARAVE|nr:hypothetical protein AVEN_257877-1 [Araneus ventricosus]
MAFVAKNPISPHLNQSIQRRSRSKAILVDQHDPSSKRSLYIVSPAGRDVTWNDLAHSWRSFSPNRDIEKIPAHLRSHISSPNLSPKWSPRSGYQTWLFLAIPYLSL